MTTAPRTTARSRRPVTAATRAVAAARQDPPVQSGAATLPLRGEGNTTRAAAPARSAARVAPERSPASVGGGSALAGGLPSRTWVIEMPPGLALLTLNQRLHWAERNRRAQVLKKAAWAIALNRKVPHLGRGRVVLEYQPPDRRERDEDNLAVTAKHCIDGLVAAGIFTDDSSGFVAYDGCRITEPFPKGRLVLHVTEVTG